MPAPSVTAGIAGGERIIGIVSDSSEQAIVGDGMLASLVLLVVGVGLAVAGRRVLARGAAAGLFAATLSAFLVYHYAGHEARDDPAWLLRLAACLASLALLWLAVSMWVERPRQDSATVPTDASATRRLVGRCFAATCGLLAVASILAAKALREVDATYAALGLLAVPAAGAGALAMVLATTLGHWRRRARLALEAPEQLLAAPPKHQRTFTWVLALGVVATVGAMGAPTAPLTPIGLALAALGVAGVGHQWRSNRVGTWGLALAGGSVICVALAWLPQGTASAALGWTLAGVWMTWLARFWEQQRLDGMPWTTAGRLIPAARRLGQAGACGALVAVAAARLSPSTAVDWTVYVAAGVLLVHWTMLMRQARVHGEAGAAWCGGLALLAAVALTDAAVAERGWAAAPAMWLGLAALLQALRAGTARGACPDAWVYNAQIAGVTPALVVFLIVLSGGWWAAPGGSAVGAVLTFVAVLVRGGLSGRRAAE